MLINENDLINFKKNQNPEVSVVMTVYNQADCFYKGLRSIQNQSLKNIEIIIVDDGSTDNSVYQIEKYQKEDNRIIFLKHMINCGTIKSPFTSSPLYALKFSLDIMLKALGMKA